MPTLALPAPLTQVCTYIYISFFFIYLISRIEVNANAGTAGTINAGMYETSAGTTGAINAGMYIYIFSSFLFI